MIWNTIKISGIYTLVSKFLPILICYIDLTYYGAEEGSYYIKLQNFRAALWSLFFCCNLLGLICALFSCAQNVLIAGSELP